MKRTIAIDWDGTLVDENGEWMPGALNAIRYLNRRDHKLIIHSTRANWESGRRQIERKLASKRLDWIPIVPKPEADFYVDNRGLRFRTWTEVIKEIRRR